MSTDQPEQTAGTQHECIACPRGEKSLAEYKWHNGMAAFANCEPCLRDALPERLTGYKQIKYDQDGPQGFVSGYATPYADPSVKIVKQSDLDDYLDGDCDE